MIKRVKFFYERLSGKWMGEIIKDINSATTSAYNRVDALLTRAQVDGEDYWFLQNQRKRPSGSYKENDTFCL